VVVGSKGVVAACLRVPLLLVVGSKGVVAACLRVPLLLLLLIRPRLHVSTERHMTGRPCHSQPLPAAAPSLLQPSSAAWHPHRRWTGMSGRLAWTAGWIGLGCAGRRCGDLR
jgi:hypothetical protein